jgi:hypothetical protein
MSGPKRVLVTKSSATHCRSWEDGPEHICAIGLTHSNMVKFSPEDVEYEKALQRLKGLARRALAVRKRISKSSAKCVFSFMYVYMICIMLKPVSVIVPYIANPDFVGRTRTLDQVKQQLGYGQHQTTIKPQSRVVLYGLGGVGYVSYSDIFVTLHNTPQEVSGCTGLYLLAS